MRPLGSARRLVGHAASSAPPRPGRRVESGTILKFVLPAQCDRDCGAAQWLEDAAAFATRWQESAGVAAWKSGAERRHDGATAFAALNGNVRELENILHRAVALGEDSLLHLDLPLATPVVRTGKSAKFPGRAGTQHPDPGVAEKQVLTAPPPPPLGLSLRQIRYRIARLGIATPV